MLSIIWQEIKHTILGSKKIFILSVLAFTCACVAINVTLTQYYTAHTEQTAAEENYGNKSFYKLILEGENEIYQRIFGEGNIGNIKAAFEQLKSDPSFQYRYNVENIIDFFSTTDSSYSLTDFPSYKNEFLYGYESGTAYVSENYLSLKAFYADPLFKDEPNVALSEGAWFNKEDFTVSDPDNINLPVILGSGYQGLYRVGDTIRNAHLGTEDEVTLHIIGFFTEDSYFYDNNNDKKILDRYMVVPAIETSYDGYDSFSKAAYDSLKMTNTRIICTKEDEKAVVSRVYEILNQNQLYEFRLFDETGGWTERLESNRNATATALTISFFIIALLFAIFCAQTYYKILKNKKKYSILKMNGITKIQLFFLIIVDTLMVYILSTVLFYILYCSLRGNLHFDMGLNPYTFIVIPSIELVLLLAMGLYGCRKAYGIDLSSALREHE